MATGIGRTMYSGNGDGDINSSSDGSKNAASKGLLLVGRDKEVSQIIEDVKNLQSSSWLITGKRHSLL